MSNFKFKTSIVTLEAKAHKLGIRTDHFISRAQLEQAIANAEKSKKIRPLMNKREIAVYLYWQYYGYMRNIIIL